MPAAWLSPCASAITGPIFQLVSQPPIQTLRRVYAGVAVPALDARMIPTARQNTLSAVLSAETLAREDTRELTNQTVQSQSLSENEDQHHAHE